VRIHLTEPVTFRLVKALLYDNDFPTKSGRVSLLDGFSRPSTNYVLYSLLLGSGLMIADGWLSFNINKTGMSTLHFYGIIFV